MLTAGKIIAEIERERAELSKGALASPAQDITAYHRLVGRYQGLTEAMQIVRTIGQDDQ